MAIFVTVDPNTVGRTNFFQTPPSQPGFASIQQAPGMASGIKAFRCEIRTGVTGTSSGDQPGGTADSPNGKNRTEALIAGGQVGSAAQNFGYNPSSGQTYWHRWRFRIQAGAQTPSSQTYNWHTTQSNSIDSNEHIAGTTLGKVTSPLSWTFDNPGTVATVAYTTEQWVDVVWKIFYSTSSSGSHTIWINGVQKSTATGKTLATSGGTGIYHKFGAYRIDPGVAGGVVLWHSGLWVGTAQADLVNVIPGVTDTGFPATGGGSTNVAPVANFSVPSTITVGSPASFTSSSTGTPAPTLQWQLDGTNVSTAATYTTTFANTTSHTVALTATNSAGANTKTVTVAATQTTPTGPPTPIMDGLSNTAFSSTSLAPWRAWTHSDNGFVRMYAPGVVSDAALPANLPRRIRLETNDDRVAANYFVNTFDNPDTLTTRSQVESERAFTVGGVTKKVAWLNETRYIVMQFFHDFPRLANPTGTPSPYDPNAVPFAGFLTTYGQPYGGSSGNGFGVENDPDGVNVRLKGLGGWTGSLPRKQAITLIVRRHFSSSIDAVDGWDEYWFSVGGATPVKQTFTNNTTRSALWANIRTGVNDDPIGNEIHVTNYHRGYMAGWDGIHYLEFTHFKVYDDADVTNVTDIFPPAISSTVSEPVANFTVPATINLGVQATFDSTSQNAVSLQWQVDGVNASTSATLAWTFTVAGAHTVALTATGQSGTTPNTKTVTVNVAQPATDLPVRPWAVADSRNGVDAAPILAVPANAVVGDDIYWTLITASHTRTLTGTLPTGITIVSDPGANGNDRSWVFTKTYQSGDPATFTLAFDTVSTGGWLSVPVAVYGTQPAQGGLTPDRGLWEVQSAARTTAASTQTSPTLSGRTSDGFALHIITDDGNGVAQSGQPNTGSVFADVQRSDLKAHIAVAWVDRPAGAAAAGLTWTLDTATQADVHALAFNTGGLPAVTGLTFGYA